jgi:hypothetical protein
MRRATVFAVSAVLLHALIVNVALILKYQYWDTSASDTAGSVQRLIDWPVLKISRFVMNRPELPLWMPTHKASDAALIREMFVADIIGGSLYGAVVFVVLSIHRRHRRNKDVIAPEP